MIKKGFLLVLVFFVISCGTTRSSTDAKPLFEILTQQEDGGASIRFFEILSEEKEIKMLQNDALLKNKISTNDVRASNFIILNMGEKNTLGYIIDVKNVEETADKIIIKVQDVEPKSKQTLESDIYYYPYSIVKINSKKQIVIE